MLRRFADHPVRVDWPVLGALAALLFVPIASFQAAEMPTGNEPEGLAPHIRKVLPILLNQGADLFNAGDPDACCRLFESTLLVLRPALADRPRLQQSIAAGLADARQKADVRERAFALRTLLDS